MSPRATTRPGVNARVFVVSITGSSLVRRPSGGVGKWVVEGVEGTVGRDRELEAISDPLVLDRHGDRVLTRISEQQDADPVALADGEFAGL
jgi:hypothetical protein